MRRFVLVRRVLQDVADDVDRLVLGLVIRARLQLGQQTQRDQLHAGEDQQDAEQQQRTVRSDTRAREPLSTPASR